MLIITSEPADEDSDPDIYISYNTSIVNQTNYTWKSTNIGADKVELHPKDP